jgi:hypothetical protein
VSSAIVYAIPLVVGLATGQAVLHEAWLITAGGLVQTMVALATRPLRPFAAKRRAVGDAYPVFAAYARAPTTAALQSTAAAVAAATETVGADSAQTGERGALRTLVEQVEWVRLELAALGRSNVPGWISGFFWVLGMGIADGVPGLDLPRRQRHIATFQRPALDHQQRSRDLRRPREPTPRRS